MHSGGRNEILGTAYRDHDLIVFLEAAGIADPKDVLDDPQWVEWRASAPPTSSGPPDLGDLTSFRLVKQTLGWTTPKIRHADTADLWTWLIIATHTQLRLARPLAEGLRRPWERPAPPRRLTPARVRRGGRNVRATVARPAAALNQAVAWLVAHGSRPDTAPGRRVHAVVPLENLGVRGAVWELAHQLAVAARAPGTRNHRGRITPHPSPAPPRGGADQPW
ncbi:hypothetical protein A6A29_40415 [Streptomyces sp. TSRI0281]|nr:hypothetical protein A6A29_40415 [Streptomyces sp. TSRI0281]